jgi:hypothetical protein
MPCRTKAFSPNAAAEQLNRTQTAGAAALETENNKQLKTRESK